MRRTTMLLALSVLALALGACGAPERRAGGVARPAAATPASLSFPYLNAEEAKIAGFREAAARAAQSYVAVEVIAPGNPTYGESGGVVHRASGIVVDGNSHIVTAAHIARSTEMSVRVTYWDGTRRTGRIIHVAPERELALIEVPGSGAKPIAFADSEKLEAGQPAVAVGSPHRQRGIGTAGRVKVPKYGERLQYGQWGFDGAVWLAMEVESGHSGGPVVNMSGALIGMVAGYELGDTTKTTYVSPRITYAVPSNAVRRYVTDRLGGS